MVLAGVVIASGIFVFWEIKKSSEGMKIDIASDVPKVSASFAGKSISFIPVDYKKDAKREEKDGNIIWQGVWEDVDIEYKEMSNDQNPNDKSNPNDQLSKASPKAKVTL